MFLAISRGCQFTVLRSSFPSSFSAHPRLRLHTFRPSSPPVFPANFRLKSTMADLIESAKRAAGQAAVKNHYPKDAKYVGIGSGSTIVYVVEAIKESGVDTSQTKYVPTGYLSKQLIVSNGLTAVEFDSLPEGTVLDIAFDGADEVDDDLNLIKGGGACLFQEKIVALQAKEFVCVADSRKLQSRLLSNWKYIPIEVAPIAASRVLGELKELGSISPALRLNPTAPEGAPKPTPLKTDQAFNLIDAPFKTLLTKADIAAGQDGSGKDGVWEVEALSRAIKQIPGVLDVGIFSGETGPQAQARGGTGGQKPIAAYFGMPDGSVSVRKASA
ncbi:ribose 5-phosphate isomerase A [Aspergillus nomiae NRRL 13137]|uniref:Ribose-5-phosphate isomerase n=1 Tax=Aspergillus nomiae NRRL (strain ATCC 15546 / NRRL 13137 / CBS 260.88 / M93) TaxID=1509407 RepID=A0A0L1IZZ0_ASPN3|nr:ribose 5-phosphate isomerase A [Aspergillus nomiae NRRL 13137]KNG84955.1 ribose 5-phosphate isomerase A [Aspergillus nomiae NRRL 13137]